MPDFERLTDKMRCDLAATPEEMHWAMGFSAGKTYARKEIAVVLCVLAVVVAVLSYWRP